MGLERLLKNLYGSDIQIDLDQKLARARVPKPGPIDFPALADGVIKNNMGLGGITVTVSSRIDDGHVVFEKTGQRHRLDGEAPAETGAQLRRVKAVDPSKSDTAVVLVP